MRAKLSTRELDYAAIKEHLANQRRAKEQQIDNLPDEDQIMQLEDPDEMLWTKQFYAAISSHMDEAHRLVQYDTFMDEMRASKKLRVSS